MIGYLIISNTTMTSISHAFANLEQVSANGNVTTAFGGSHSVVIVGLRSLYAWSITLMMAGNDGLTDLGNILLFQVSAPTNTLVANNSVLCFNPSVEWGRLASCLIEYNTTQVCETTHHIQCRH